jgi:4-hydroxybenzoate polyprenyltransferase
MVQAGRSSVSSVPIGASGHPRPFAIFAKMTKAPFWVTWITPAVFGYFASADGSFRQLPWFVFLCVTWCIAEGTCNVHNDLVDQEEDVINQPHRARRFAYLIEAWGERRLWQIVFAGYALAGVTVVLMGIFVEPMVALAFAYLGAQVVFYNFGLRLKRRPGYVEVTLVIAAVAAFLLGWAFHRSALDMPAEVWVLAYFMAVTVFSKDLPDTVGDEAVNAASIFSIRTPRRLRAALVFIYLSPYALVLALVLGGVLGPRFLALGLLLPLGAWFAFAADSLRSLEAKVAAYHLAFTYGHLFLLALFVLSVSTAGAVIAAGALLVARLVTLALRLDPRLVEPDFSSWSSAFRALLREQRVRPSLFRSMPPRPGTVTR